MNKGFVLIELVIATLIASMISILLLTALQQATKSQAVIDNNIDIHTRAIIFFQQFEKDIMGAFVPVQGYKESTHNKLQKKPLLDYIFYSSNQNQKLETLTFITTNPLAVYWGEKTGSAKPRVARIVYRLNPDNEKKESFVLFRQEGSDLPFPLYKKENIKGARAYQLINGIKNLSIDYAIPEDQKDKGKKLTYKIVNTWNWPSKEKQEKIKEPPLPKFITVILTLWDNNYQNDVSFTFTFSLLSEVKKEEPIKIQQTKKQQPQLNQPAINNKVNPQNQIHSQVTISKINYK
jgi:type II secretory pathway pseudopilin PulG